MNSLSDDSILGKRVTQQDIGNDHRDIISFLAIAHNCDVDILPILWQPTLNVLGWGATSLINQSLINVHTSFAFKRTSSYLSTNSISGRDVSKANFGSLITEVLILRHPLIRNHANIIDLEGICWDSDGVWPVLVFQRAHLGDLQSFTNYKYDQSASLEIELGLCTDISMAVMALHDCSIHFHLHSLNVTADSACHRIDIVHGDIKPQNVLIFKDGKGGLQAKLTDFGHSCLGKDENDPIYLPRSRPWNDPNWDDECFEIHEAKRMDIYSLGMVCLFVLCHSTHTWSSSEPTTTIPGYDRPISFQSIWEERNIDVFEDLKWRDLLPGIAHSLVSTIVSLDPARQNSLAMFFSLTLAKKPDSRQPDCRKLIQLLNPNQ
jgi:serine/threonine protein kinase